MFAIRNTKFPRRSNNHNYSHNDLTNVFLEGELILDSVKIHSGNFRVFYNSDNEVVRIVWNNGYRNLREDLTMVSNSIVNSKSFTIKRQVEPETYREIGFVFVAFLSLILLIILREFYENI